MKQGDYSHLCRILCKSGEKVDSMNVFPTSLASMIDDLRACTHKQLPELFPRRGRCPRCGSSTATTAQRTTGNTANVMGWETFRKFHNCYLHTDVLALAGDGELPRLLPGLDPIHYVTLPGAAWDAMLRHSARKTVVEGHAQQ